MKKRMIWTALLVALLVSFTFNTPAASLTAMSPTLTTANATYNLRTVLMTVDTRVADDFAEATLCGNDLNTATVYLGADTTLSATNYGVALGAGDCITFRALDRTDSIKPSLFYVQSTDASQKIDFLGRQK